MLTGTTFMPAILMVTTPKSEVLHSLSKTNTVVMKYLSARITPTQCLNEGQVKSSTI